MGYDYERKRDWILGGKNKRCAKIIHLCPIIMIIIIIIFIIKRA